MFDIKNLNTTMETMTAKAEEAVNTTLTTAEENTKKINGYIQDDIFRNVADAYVEASFGVARAVFDANKIVAENVKKAFVS